MSLVRHNDWRAITPPALGAWTPTKTVSVVVPSWGGRHLPWVLAALAAQTYPSHLTEVVVIDDGNPEPLVLPELRPESTRVLRVEEGWGRAGATQVGMDATDGEIFMWLDDDMLTFAEHIEAHARWHHVTDHAVVMGVKRFVAPEVPLTPEETFAAVADGSIGQLHDWDASVPHTWVEDIWAGSDDLTTAGYGAFRCFVSATASMSRAMVEKVGAVRSELKLGEDTEYGHRLGQAGAVLLPEHAAKSWHLGNSHAMEHTDTVNRYNQPAFADLVPTLRRRRMSHGRVYQVPFVEVVVPADGPVREVQRSVDTFLESDLSDLAVVLVGEWGQIDDERVSPLSDPLRDLKIVHRRYVNEPRVRLLTPDAAALRERPEAVFRLVVGRTDLVPLPGAVRAWADDMERTRTGLRVFTGDGGSSDVVARLERVAAFARAEWQGTSFFDAPPTPEAGPVDEVVDQVAGVVSCVAEGAGWVKWRARKPERERRKDLELVDPETSWQLALAHMGLAGDEPSTGSEVASADAPAGGRLGALGRFLKR